MDWLLYLCSYTLNYKVLKKIMNPTAETSDQWPAAAAQATLVAGIGIAILLLLLFMASSAAALALVFT